MSPPHLSADPQRAPLIAPKKCSGRYAARLRREGITPVFPTVLIFDHTGKDKIKYPEAIAAALRAELGDSHRAVKSVMRWTGVNERTAKNWLAGRRGPRGEHLLALMRHSNVVLEIVLQLAGREQIIAGKALFDARNA